MRGTRYQIALISLGVLVTILFGLFFYWEMFPEYKIFQNRYVELEEFRSSYTGDPPPVFKKEIKQLVFEPEDKGQAKIDRCVSCHVAMQFEHFSPTKLEKDINGNIVLNDEGIPQKVPNENYIWAKLDQKIQELEKTDPSEADRLRSWKTVKIEDHTFDMTKVLAMHPLIGTETRPFEYHPLNEYGCTTCHNGNGRGLTTLKAHGPVYDGQYEAAYMGPMPVFVEEDPRNDPMFARVFNDKPGHELLFQTNPLFVGDLIQANCVQCHQTTRQALRTSIEEANSVTKRREQKSEAVRKAFNNEKQALISLLSLIRQIENDGYEKTVKELQAKVDDFTISPERRESIQAQLKYLTGLASQEAKENLRGRLREIVGSQTLAKKLLDRLGQKNGNISKLVTSFIQKFHDNPEAKGPIFTKYAAVQQDRSQLAYVENIDSSLQKTISDPKSLQAFDSQIDQLTQSFHKGKELFISQACYGCHRVEGMSRGGIGPELSYIGRSYPWYIKESMTWPQADLATSQMPNYKMDHEELEELMTYLLSLQGRPKAVSESSYRRLLTDWEAGEKLPWENPINPGKLQDLDYSMTIFGTEGCAACHRLKGFESNVGFAIEKKDPDWNALYNERQWFQNLIPEMIQGSELVRVLEEHGEEIDRRIVANVRENSILEEIEEKHPGLIESFYTEFKYANRGKNHELEGEALNKWKDRVRRVLMAYVQEYGYGRLIGPRPNWSGIYRSDEWLIQHFRKPSALVARSIMPVMPFDDSKFYALTYMLDVLAIKNRDQVHEIWKHKGFNPELAYQIHCSQCHGEYLHGNGPVSEWIYPIPKNLRNAEFLRNLTKERVTQSIIHGIKGGPMPPWGEAAKDKPTYDGIPVLSQNEVKQMVDWLFSTLLGGTVIRGEEDVPKWQYGPEDILREIKEEGNRLKPGPVPDFINLQEVDSDLSALFPETEHYYAARESILSPAKQQTTDVSEVFDVIPSDEPGPEEYNYYIKKKYYTEENINQGQVFFETNCAICHGREADGAGFRAGTMFDAKPRMLVNLQWVDSRDDLRLLRSIKYGVRGTSMTPWGDQTSSLQRMQLVIYIRTLSMEQNRRDQIFDAIYQVFDTADQVLDLARIKEFKKINEIQNQINTIEEKRQEYLQQDEESELLSSYEEERKLTHKLAQHQASDQLLVELKKEVQQESELYQTLGIQLVNKVLMGDILDTYLKAVNLDNGIYTVKNGYLEAEFDPEKEEKITQLGKKMAELLEERNQKARQRKELVEAKIASAQKDEMLEMLNKEIEANQKIRNDVISTFNQAKRSRNRQQRLVDQYEKKIKQLQKQQEA